MNDKQGSKGGGKSSIFDMAQEENYKKKKFSLINNCFESAFQKKQRKSITI